MVVLPYGGRLVSLFGYRISGGVASRFFYIEMKEALMDEYQILMIVFTVIMIVVSCLKK